MKFIEHAGINKIGAVLSRVDVGDRVMSGTIEAFSTKDPIKDETEIERKWLNTSPLGALRHKNNRTMFINLLSGMNQCFPDYDFSEMAPSSFMKIPTADARNDINFHLSNLVGRMFPSFLDDFWKAVKDVVIPNSCDVYCIKSDILEDELFADDTCLMAFLYFLVDNATDAAVLLCVRTHSKTSPTSESEVVDSQQGTGMSSCDKPITSSGWSSPLSAE